MVFCPGCWQEVVYVPSEPAKTTLASNTAANEQESTDVVQEPAEATPPDAQTPVEVTSSELFAHDAAATFEPEPSRTEAPPSLLESQPADLDLEPETSARTIAASPEELPTTAENDSSIREASEKPNVDTLRPSRTAFATWRMSSLWSLAAAIHAKGQPVESYRDLLDQASYAAGLIDIELPQLPIAASEELQKFVASYLLHEGSEQFADELRGEYPVEYAALAEFAIRSNALLLVYTPKNQQLNPVVESIRMAVTNSGLPAEYWEKLLGMLDRRERFADVKAEVLAMHTAIGDYLSGE